MGFWDKHLDTPQQSAPAPSGSTPGSWWAPQPTGRQQQQQVQNSRQQASSDDYAWDGEHTNEEVLAHFTKHAHKAKSHTDRCPECGSGNYTRATAESYLKCFECGYNDRFSQMAAGMPTSPGESSAPSKQIAFGGGQGNINNFNPVTAAKTLTPMPYANAGA